MPNSNSIADPQKEKVMSEVWESANERSRKAVGGVLQAMQTPGKGVAIASAMGVSEATVSRLKNEQMEGVVAFLYHAGFKVVPQDYRCIPDVQARAWFDSHLRELERKKESDNLWAED